MKISTAAILGLLVVLGLTTTMAHMGEPHCPGVKHDEAVRAIWKKCGGMEMKDEQAVHPGTEISEEVKIQFAKATMCLMKTNGALNADNKLSMPEVNKMFAAMYDTPEAGQRVQAAYKKCCEEEHGGKLAEKTYSKVEDMEPMIQCSLKAFKAGCKN